jgi:enoyl-CoA hydratase/carnithine racemase
VSDQPAPNEAKIVESLEGGTLVLTMSNPDRRNAFTPEMRVDMAARIEAGYANNAVRAIIIRGEGAHFSAGADVSRIPIAEPPTPLQLLERIKGAQGLVRSIALGTKPVIAAVEGIATGGGISLAIAADYCVVAEDARLVPNFTSLGITAEFGLFYTLPRRVGHQRAKRIIMLSERFTGAEAVAIGMADKLAPSGQALAVALEVAKEFEKIPPLALGATKRAFASRMESIEDALKLELDIMPALGQSADFKEAIAAFKEKRAPNFSGR